MANKPQLSFHQEDINKNMEACEEQTSGTNEQSDKLGNLKPSLDLNPLNKKWFRKQFGVRKDKIQLEGGAKPQVMSMAPFQKSRRRSSSLPDLSAMLDAANFKRHGSFINGSPGPTRMGRKLAILSEQEAPWTLQPGRLCPYSTTQTTMTTKKNKPPQLVLQQEDENKNVEILENQTSNPNVEKNGNLSNLKPPLSPLTKKWFRKQFGIRKNITQLEAQAKPQTLSPASFQKSRRRSSSLPDLASMLEAATLKRHDSFKIKRILLDQ